MHNVISDFISIFQKSNFKKDLEKSQVEITVELTPEEFAPYIEKGAQKVSEEVKIKVDVEAAK